MDERSLYKNGSGGSPYEKLLNKIVVGETKKGRRFCTKLVGITDEELVFETRSGQTIVNSRADIEYLFELERQPEAV